MKSWAVFGMAELLLVVKPPPWPPFAGTWTTPPPIWNTEHRHLVNKSFSPDKDHVISLHQWRQKTSHHLTFVWMKARYASKACYRQNDDKWIVRTSCSIYNIQRGSRVPEELSVMLCLYSFFLKVTKVILETTEHTSQVRCLTHRNSALFRDVIVGYRVDFATACTQTVLSLRSQTKDLTH